ncbi:hypothetical protein JCM8547_000441 [Rhodosporidiobolus lusitaniae]
MDPSTSTESFVLVNHSPASLGHFFPSFASSTKDDHDLPAQLAASRAAQPDGQLFIDHLLSLALPPGTALYPPHSHNDLLALVDQLSSSPLNSLTARSCLYYLALVFSPPLAHQLASDSLLPSPFRLATRAFHALDTGDYPLGVKLLADPRVTPDFIPRTFALLDQLPPAEDRSRLVLSYWRLAGISLEGQSKNEVKVVIRALCGAKRKSGVDEAWELARSWKNEDEREDLARAVLATCFGNNPAGLPIAQHLSTLLARSFTAPEDALTTTFAVSPPSPLDATLVADWRLSKLIAESRPVDALRFWSSVKKRGAVSPNEQRDRLLTAVEANLTSIQKATLSLEIGAARPAPVASTSSAAITQPAWAPVPAPPAQLPRPPPQTLAAARLAQLPPPAPAAPTAADLPLSASSFLRTGGAGPSSSGGVLRALEVAQQATPKKPSPATAQPVVASPFLFPTPQKQQVQPRAVSVSVSEASQVVAASPAAKPTLSGFGTIRQAPTQPLQQPHATPKASSRQASRRFEPEPKEDEEMAEAGAPAQQHEQDHDEEEQQDYAFALRAAQDPAIAATIAAASAPPPRQLSSSSTSQTPKRSRVSNGAGARDRARQRGDKRRAVSVEPAEEGGERKGGKAGRKVEERTAVKLPPGAFPGQDEEEEREEQQDETEEQEKPEPKRRTSRTPARSSSASSKGKSLAAPPPSSTTQRRSTRQSTAELEAQQQDDPAPSSKSKSRARAVRRSTRASSVISEAPEEAEENEEEAGGRKALTRRSSRLSTVATPARRGKKGAEEDEEEQGGRRTVRRSTRRGTRTIEEED